MPRFKSICPFCESRDWINWSHTGCSGSNGGTINIDIEGYIACNSCNKKMDLLDICFYCDTYDVKKRIERKTELRKLVLSLIKVDAIDDDFFDNLYENLLKRWEKTH